MTELAPLPSLEPTRDPRVTLPDLLEVLLNRGVVLNLDLIIAVADIPLIGVSLKAAVAGIETMLEYGMMRQWDEQTRAWVQRSISRNVPFEEGEELVARMAGGHEHSGFFTTWRPGTLYLTSHRLFVFRREPREMLWEAQLSRITGVDGEPERAIGGEDRIRLRVMLDDGTEARLSAAEPERMLRLIREQVPRLGGENRSAAPNQPPAPIREGRLWYHEPRAGGAVWRGGTGRLDARSGFTWKSPLDARPAVALPPHEIRSVRFEHGRTPGGSRILTIGTRDEPVHLACDDAHAWADAIIGMLEADTSNALMLEVDDGADGR